MIQCDALIVGGGPAGSSCAWRLHEAGLDVIVVDASTFPRDKVCAGWITPQVVAAIRLDTLAYASGRTWQPFTGFRVGLIGNDAETRVEYGEPVSFGIRRCEFDHYLLRRSGARLSLGTPVAAIRRDRGTWVVNETFRAPLLVGAGGSNCPVARRLGTTLRGRASVVAQEAEWRADRPAAPGVNAAAPELFFCRDLQGYGWCVRKGDFLNVGLGRLDPRALPAAVAGFVSFLERHGKIPRQAPSRWRGHAYAVSACPSRIVDTGVVLVGDAAGVADPQSGEGIRQAVESGLLAAQTIVEARGEYSRCRLEPYTERLRARLPRTPFSTAIGRLVPTHLKASAAARLLGVPGFVQHVVLDRWFLHRHELAFAG
jgi:geranylgeranyl reductase family protein